jgi:hypothetical protein
LSIKKNINICENLYFVILDKDLSTKKGYTISGEIQGRKRENKI